MLTLDRVHNMTTCLPSLVRATDDTDPDTEVE